MQIEIVRKYSDVIIKSMGLLFSRKYDELVRLDLMQEYTIEFIKFAIEEFDCSYYVVPNRSSILTSEVVPYEDGRGYQVFVEAPLSIKSDGGDTVLVGIEILHDGSIELVTASIINHEIYRKEFLTKSLN